MGRTVAHAVVSYMDAAGNWQTALRGAEIDVHADDLGRLEAAGTFDAPAAPVPPVDGIEDLSSDEDDPGPSKRRPARKSVSSNK